MDKKKSLFKEYKLEDYPEIGSVDFPKEIHVAYAVCARECGNREFIVDGQTVNGQFVFDRNGHVKPSKVANP